MQLAQRQLKTSSKLKNLDFNLQKDPYRVLEVP